MAAIKVPEISDAISESNSECESVGRLSQSADSESLSSSDAPFVHSPYSFWGSSPDSPGSLGYEISCIPKFPDHWEPAHFDAPAPVPSKAFRQKNRKQRPVAMAAVIEHEQRPLSEESEKCDSSCKSTHGTPCTHQSNWKRLRAKRGYAYFVCYLCGAKWRTLLRGEQ